MMVMMLSMILICRWNFAPAPGWTREEAHTLKLCLMKYGVGRWTQIHGVGLLPGKLIGQLCGQTQRLLGQQSLASEIPMRLKSYSMHACMILLIELHACMGSLADRASWDESREHTHHGKNATGKRSGNRDPFGNSSL